MGMRKVRLWLSDMNKYRKTVGNSKYMIVVQMRYR
jgi:hypothetical protein